MEGVDMTVETGRDRVAMQPKRLLRVGQYDINNDYIEIEGIRYSGLLFREFGFHAMIGEVLRIDKREDGVLTVTRVEGAKGE